ncbi:MAG: PAS domain S-box protein [Deltaproteobacteria bacterium]|nr:PAS domain S-box protein [Deltaproteobacteria bacterium]
MKLSEKNRIVLPLLTIAVFVFSSFGWIFYFQNYQSKKILETIRLLDSIDGDIKEFNRTIQSSILTLDDAYAVKSAAYSLRIFDNLDKLSKLHPDDTERIRHEYMNYCVKLVSISSLFLEKRREEGKRHLAELEISYEKINREISVVLDDETGEYAKAVRNINIFMFVTTFVFALFVASIIGLFMHYGSERRKAEQALREAREYTDNIVRSMADALLVLDPDATIHTVNKTLCELLEYEEEELLGRPMDKIVVDEMVKDTLLKLIGEGHIRDYQMSYRAKSGEKIPVSLHVSAMYKQEGDIKTTVAIIFIARDLREIKQLQRHLLQTEKMAALGAMAAGVAHEIKNPLAIILQGTEYLQSMLPDDTAAIEVTGRVRSAVLRADRIVKGLMSFSKQATFSFEVTDISGVIEETLSLLDHQVKLRNIAVVRDFAPDLCMPKIDATQMKQVFLNLLLNATDALPGGGTITIALQKIGTHFLHITFADNGPGMTGQTIEKAFDPFFTTRQKEGHAGLGLSIARGIIEAHKGTISIESAEGKGTSVIIGLTCP